MMIIFIWVSSFQLTYESLICSNIFVGHLLDSLLHLFKSDLNLIDTDRDHFNTLNYQKLQHFNYLRFFPL